MNIYVYDISKNKVKLDNKIRVVAVKSCFGELTFKNFCVDFLTLRFISINNINFITFVCLNKLSKSEINKLNKYLRRENDFWNIR